MKIYTRTGDAGDTSLFDGTRVRKDDARVDAYGEVDELNAWLGLARSSLGDRDLDDEIARVQRDLFAVGAELADPTDKIAARVTKASITEADVDRLERRSTASKPSSIRSAVSFWPAGRHPGGVSLARRLPPPSGGSSRCPPATILLRYVNPVRPPLRRGPRGQQTRSRAETEW